MVDFIKIVCQPVDFDLPVSLFGDGQVGGFKCAFLRLLQIKGAFMLFAAEARLVNSDRKLLNVFYQAAVVIGDNDLKFIFTRLVRRNVQGQGFPVSDRF